MTFSELLHYLNLHMPLEILIGDAQATIDSALKGAHPNELVGQVIASMFEKSGVENVHSDIERARAVAALGPIRLRFMKDDAPVEGFRIIESIVHHIDGAYNEEALRLKSQGKQI